MSCEFNLSRIEQVIMLSGLFLVLAYPPEKLARWMGGHFTKLRRSWIKFNRNLGGVRQVCGELRLLFGMAPN